MSSIAQLCTTLWWWIKSSSNQVCWGWKLYWDKKGIYGEFARFILHCLSIVFIVFCKMTSINFKHKIFYPQLKFYFSCLLLYCFSKQSTLAECCLEPVSYVGRNCKKLQGEIRRRSKVVWIYVHIFFKNVKTQKDTRPH